MKSDEVSGVCLTKGCFAHSLACLNVKMFMLRNSKHAGWFGSSSSVWHKPSVQENKLQPIVKPSSSPFPTLNVPKWNCRVYQQRVLGSYATLRMWQMRKESLLTTCETVNTIESVQLFFGNQWITSVRHQPWWPKPEVHQAQPVTAGSSSTHVPLRQPIWFLVKKVKSRPLCSLPTAGFNSSFPLSLQHFFQLLQW